MGCRLPGCRFSGSPCLAGELLLEFKLHSHYQTDHFLGSAGVVNTIIAGIVACRSGDLNDSLTGDHQRTKFAAAVLGGGTGAFCCRGACQTC